MGRGDENFLHSNSFCIFKNHYSTQNLKKILFHYLNTL
ncbi:hypothetical protein HPHPP13_1030 [Helicobacter pylori Hp P-13]|uniref:Uncharacterized protein n=1 Tax=Helicobacter pylori Hp P-13b TaxID=992107 RepID=A0ABC9QRH6_HELPX|nr:hypothetical protein HPHPP13_1030 [Helicobacter pylori Hp P-13]EJC31459.1 hypothetical protein HPHPP13B_1024 [Helicobacter pylori Hp P-13b]